MLVKKLVVGESATNCYIVYDQKSLEAVIIDPGDDAEYIKDVVRDLNLIPRNVLVTHKHRDHLGAALELKLVYNASSSTLVGDLKIIKTPGHTKDSVSFYSKKGKFVIVGDIDSFVYDRKLFNKSISKLAKLPKDTVVYQGHGDETSISMLQ